MKTYLGLMRLFLVLTLPLSEIGARDLHLSSSPERFLEGDRAYRERKLEARAREALRLYQAEWKKSPEDAEAAWRYSMASHFVGMRFESDADERIRLFGAGRDVGLKATRLSPNCAACHFWTAINMSLYGQEVGVFKMLFSLGDVREHLRATIALDPSYAYGGAHRVLGIISQKLPGILGGSDEKAVEEYELALKASPDEPLNYLFLARILMTEMGKRERALELARQALGLSPPTRDRVESVEAREELEALLHAESPLAVVAKAND